MSVQNFMICQTNPFAGWALFGVLDYMLYVYLVFATPQVFLTFGTTPAARSGIEKENSTPIEVLSSVFFIMYTSVYVCT